MRTKIKNQDTSKLNDKEFKAFKLWLPKLQKAYKSSELLEQDLFPHVLDTGSVVEWFIEGNSPKDTVTSWVQDQNGQF